MKKFDALLYLSSVTAGVGMIAANLLSVYDVSDYSPAVPTVQPIAYSRSAEAEVVVARTQVAAVQGEPCVACLGSGAERDLPAEEKSRGFKGRMLTPRELGVGNGAVVPVSGAGLQR